MASISIPKTDKASRIALQKLSNRLKYDSSPTFTGLTLTGLTASRLVQTNASKGLSSVTNFTNWVAGTTNRITVADDGDGTITLSAPQDIHTGASPTFAGLALGAGSITMTGSIGSTSARVTKGWFTDLECTNAMVGGLIALSASSGVLIKNYNGATVASFGLGGADSLNVGLLGNTVNTGNFTKTGCCVFNTNSAVFQPTADSTTFFQILDADGGTPIFNVDSTNEQVGVGTSTFETGYVMNIGGFVNSVITVNQSTYPSFNFRQSPTTLQNGSAFTGTEATMSTQWIAVKFTASDNHTMGDFQIRVKESANITNTIQTLTGYIYADDGGSPSKPTGAALATGLGITFGTLTTSYQILSVGTQYTMVSGTSYWLVLKYSAAPVGGNIVLDSDVSANMGATSPDGTTWTNTNVRLRYVIRGLTYIGIFGSSTNNTGVYCQSENNIGVRGLSTNSYGVFGASTNSFGVYGESFNNYGVYGASVASFGGRFQSTSNFGLYATSTSSVGVYGESTSSGGTYGISTSGFGIYGQSTTNSSGRFYRNNTAGTATAPVVNIIQDSATSETNTVLRVQGDGTGDLFNFFDGTTEVFTLLDGGFLGLNEVAPETLIELTHATPYLTLHNDTHEDTAGGRESRIIAKGEQSGGEETTLGYMEFAHDGALDDEKGYWKLYTNVGTDGNIPTLALTVDSSQNLTLPGDNRKLILGTGSDAEIYYNGTNLILSPRVVGTGGVTIGIGTTGVDYTLIFDGETNDGTITWMEDENYFTFSTVRKEFQITSVSLAPGGSGATHTNLGNYDGWAYTINDNMIATFEVPHDWDSSTAINIILYWAINEAYVTNTGEVQWQVAWSATPPNETEALDAPTHTGTIDYGDQNIPATAKYLTKTGNGVIAAASLAAGDLVGLTISRVALDAGNNPVAEPMVHHIEVHYISNRLGETV